MGKMEIGGRDFAWVIEVPDKGKEPDDSPSVADLLPLSRRGMLDMMNVCAQTISQLRALEKLAPNRDARERISVMVDKCDDRLSLICKAPPISDVAISYIPSPGALEIVDNNVKHLNETLWRFRQYLTVSLPTVAATAVEEPTSESGYAELSEDLRIKITLCNHYENYVRQELLTLAPDTSYVLRLQERLTARIRTLHSEGIVDIPSISLTLESLLTDILREILGELFYLEASAHGLSTSELAGQRLQGIPGDPKRAPLTTLGNLCQKALANPGRDHVNIASIIRFMPLRG